MEVSIYVSRMETAHNCRKLFSLMHCFLKQVKFQRVAVLERINSLIELRGWEASPIKIENSAQDMNRIPLVDVHGVLRPTKNQMSQVTKHEEEDSALIEAKGREKLDASAKVLPRY